MKVKKRCVVLLEVMIALALTALILTFLLGYYRFLSVAETQNESLRQEAFNERRVQSRLRIIFARLTSRMLYTEDREGQYAKGLTCVFSRENGAVIDPDLTNEVLSRVYVTPGGELCMITWPLDSEKKQEAYKEILMSGVKRIGWEFYYPFSSNGELIDELVTSLEKEGEDKGLPAYVRVRIFVEEDHFDVVCPVLGSKQVVKNL